MRKIIRSYFQLNPNIYIEVMHQLVKILLDLTEEILEIIHTFIEHFSTITVLFFLKKKSCTSWENA